MRRLALLLVLISACSDDPCEGVSGTCVGLSEGASATEIQTALIEAQPGRGYYLAWPVHTG